MEFKQQHAIYLQIAEHVCGQILRKEILPGDKIPSVRDFAINIMVNPNTVVRAYTYLEAQEIIYKQRGIGYFLSKDAYVKTLNLRKNIFLKQQLPKMLVDMRLLGISLNDIKKIAGENYETK